MIITFDIAVLVYLKLTSEKFSRKDLLFQGRTDHIQSHETPSYAECVHSLKKSQAKVYFYISKISEDQWYSSVFRGYRAGKLA